MALTILQKCDREKWLRIANQSRDDNDAVWTMDYLKKIIQDGNDVVRNDIADQKMKELCELFDHAYQWEMQAAKLLQSKHG